MSNSNSSNANLHDDRHSNSQDNPQDNSAGNRPNKPQSLTFLQMVHSVAASFFGVQSAEKRERDFTYGKAKHFIAVGILMTLVWYGSIALLVHFVLRR